MVVLFCFVYVDTDPDDLPSCLETCSKNNCGPEQKGVSVCSAMFEYKDEPDPKDPDKKVNIKLFKNNGRFMKL